MTVRIGATPARLPNPVVKHHGWEAAPGACLLTFEGIARYMATNGHDVLVEPLGACERDAGAFLVGQPLGALLQQRGLTTLRASAVGTGGGAVLFAGFKGTGKSTLAAALAQRGLPLLGDGVTAVASGADGCFMALPGVPFVRVAADSLEALGREPPALRRTHSGSRKYLMPAARLCTEPQPVQAVYVLRVAGGTDVEIKPRAPARAADALLTHTYLKRSLYGLGMEARHVHTVERMAARVPVFHIDRPARPMQLDALAERIMAHLQASAGVERPPDAAAAAPAGGSSAPTGRLSPFREAVTRHRAALRTTQGNGGLFDQAKGVLQRKLAARPNDVEALLRLADVHRGEGDLEAALEACRRVLAVRPEHPKASWLHAILDAAGLPKPPANQDARPVPFARAKDFLARAQHDALLTRMLAGGRRDFNRPALVNSGYRETDVRRSLAGKEEVLRQAWLRLEPRLREFLAGCLPRLRAGGLGGYRLQPLSVNAYLGGGFYGPHRDRSDECTEPREINCVYYLHRQPKPFSGGDLLLHDGPEAYTFTRIEPLDNSLVVFPSSALHEVTAVEGDLDDFSEGRFSVNATLRKRRADGG